MYREGSKERHSRLKKRLKPEYIQTNNPTESLVLSLMNSDEKAEKKECKRSFGPY